MSDDKDADETKRMYDLVFGGRTLSAETAAELEEKLIKDPTDLDSRLSLLGYYLHGRFSSRDLKTQRIAHVAWLVDNEPRHEVHGPYTGIFRDLDGRTAYADIKSRWLRQIERNRTDTTILKNAAEFFLHEEKELSERLFMTAKELEPNNAEWPDRLSHLYQLWGGFYQVQALAECELAIELSKDKRIRFYYQTSLPERAFAAEDYDKAQVSAKALLESAKEFKDNWNYGNAVNTAHTILGRIALARGDRTAARLHLLESVKGAASPQTESFGPDRKLAAELLSAGETDAVLEYFDECEKFWTSGSKQVKKWRAKIEKGESPLTSFLDERQEFFDLIDKPRSLYKMGKFDLARESAEKLLELAEQNVSNERNYGYAVHLANVVLGQLALKSGDNQKAKEHLMKAASVSENERLQDSGLDLSLAADLAQYGEREAVMEFLQKTAECWANEDIPDFDEWIEKAARGEISNDLLW